ncbi:MAG TPA: DUF167 domain-containing protein [Pirellulaceae bacterium]|nr:DUF167 domain-containing protein [Pirellulaceae bacterium]
MQIRVKVKPNAKTEDFQQESDGTWSARIQAPPVDGKANAALIEMIARHFGVKKKAVTIQSGTTARLKRVHIDGV